MLCVRCGAALTDPNYCSVCGTDIKIYRKLTKLSNTYYNRGLEKAKVRNLTGAMADLQYSLKLNKKNIPARNLLGLIYFEVGEVVSALTEWIISKNLQPDKNAADDYIRAVQSNPARLDTINQTIKKYNQSLLYCQQGSEDLAIIQLKKVLSLNPKLVKAHQLLALLYIRTEDFERAARELRRALAIDKTDNTTLRYQDELEKLTGKALHRSAKPEKETKEKQNPDIISYTSGNETIIMPASYKENTGANAVLNIIIGLVVGIALMWFLVVPAKLSSVRNEKNEQVRQYSDQLSEKQARIDSLEKELAGLQPAEGEEEENSQAGGSYEKLIEAYVSFQGQDSEAAATALAEVDPEQLSESAKGMYNEIYKTVYAQELKEQFDKGSAAYSAQNYAEAIESLEQVVAVDELYENGYALYYLARAYEAEEQNEPAVELFQRFAENFPGTERAAYSTNAIARLQQ